MIVIRILRALERSYRTIDRLRYQDEWCWASKPTPTISQGLQRLVVGGLPLDAV